MQTKPKIIRVYPSLKMAFDPYAEWPSTDNGFTYAINRMGSALRAPGHPDISRTLQSTTITRTKKKFLLNNIMLEAGFEPVTAPRDPSKTHIIAALLPTTDPADGVLWLKQDRDGSWSHKSGAGGHAHNQDDESTPIRDLMKARFGAHRTLVGYYKISEDGAELPNPLYQKFKIC